MDCFPATPCQATVWYDQQLLVATAAAQHSGPVAIQADCAALKQLHIHNGCEPGHPGIWTNLSSASQNWHRVEEFRESSGRQLKCFFLDITCQFQGYWERVRRVTRIPTNYEANRCIVSSSSGSVVLKRSRS
ncbi:TPA: hypothetical protein ACH3X1_001237 [Trebouxia sp. C0004]